MLTHAFLRRTNLSFDVRVDSLAVVPEMQLEEARMVFDGPSTSLTSD